MDEAFYRSYFEIEGRHWWFLGRRRLFLRLIEDRFGARRPIDMLDFGCGTGAFLEHLERFGAVSAVDSDASAVAFCHTRGRTEVQLVPADAPLPFPDASFDLATALDVVEHIDDDVAALAELRRVLRPDGVLLVAVPAFMFLWGKQDEVSTTSAATPPARCAPRSTTPASPSSARATSTRSSSRRSPPCASAGGCCGGRARRRATSTSARRCSTARWARCSAPRRARRAPQPAVRRVGARAGEAAMTARSARRSASRPSACCRTASTLRSSRLLRCSASTTASRRCSPGSPHCWRAFRSTATGHSHRARLRSTTRAALPDRVRLGGRARCRPAHVLRRGRGAPRGPGAGGGDPRRRAPEFPCAALVGVQSSSAIRGASRLKIQTRPHTPRRRAPPGSAATPRHPRRRPAPAPPGRSPTCAPARTPARAG